MKDDRGELDLIKQKETYKTQIEGYKQLLKLYKEQLWNQRLILSENEKNKNLVEGYKQVIKDLSNNVR